MTVLLYKNLTFLVTVMSNTETYILFKKHNPKKITHIQFRLQLIERLLQEYHVPEEQVRHGRPSALSGGDPLRLTGRHFPKYVPASPKINAQESA